MIRPRARAVALAAAIGAVALVVAAPPGAALDVSVDTPPRWAQARDAAVRPGSLLVSGGQACTGNFVFTDAAGAVYIGEAAHCTSEGSPANFDGCRDPARPLGTKVAVAGTDVVGTLAYSSWLTMQRVGEQDRAACLNNDFALIRLPDGARRSVNPSVPFFGGPTGLDSGSSERGDLLYSYGNSPYRAGIGILSPKRGIVLEQADQGWTHQTYFVTPVIPGDSGSAVLDADGRALGVASSLILFPSVGSNGVADLARALAYARAHSGIKGLTLALGTEPFTAG